MTETRFVGQSVPKVDGKAKVTGTLPYPQDYSMEGMLFAKVVWPKYPHAKVLKIDTSKAEAVPGVVKVLTYRDVPVNEFGIYDMDQEVFVAEGSKVRWIGDPVALVVAETEEIAEKARDLVDVEYEPLPVVENAEEALKPGAPLVYENRANNILKEVNVHLGDIEDAFSSADVIVEMEVRTPAIEHAYLQPEAGLGYIDEEGRVVVVAAAQWAHDDVRQLAHLLNLPEEKVREIVPGIGGAFGGREDMSIQHLVAVAAYVLRKPVKLVWTREESFRGHGKRHPFVMKYKWAAKNDGTLLGAKIKMLADAGAHTSTSIVVLSNAVSFSVGPYRVPAIELNAKAVFTNNAPTMAMRGFGATQPPVAYEQMMDELASRLGLDPVEIRLKNLVKPGDRGAVGQFLPRSVEAGEEVLTKAATAAGWRQVEGRWTAPELPEPSAPGRKRGIGLALTYKNIAYSFGFDDKATAIVDLYLNGKEIEKAVVRIGTSDVGQGSNTVLTQIAADALGVDISRVEMAPLDTSNVRSAGSSSASRQTYMSGNAVFGACRQALRMLARGEVDPNDPNHIESEYTFYLRKVHATFPFDPNTGLCEPHALYGFSCQVAEVEVDTDTGEVEVVKIVSAQDMGKAVNPKLVWGQVAGAVHMGVGYALMEEFRQRDGYVYTRNFSEYLIPTVLDMPYEFESINVEVPEETGPFGAKGMGEMPTLPTAPAILNAIHDAVGIRLPQIPATAERVWQALNEGGRS